MAAKLRATLFQHAYKQAHRIEGSRAAGEELIAAAREVVAAWRDRDRGMKSGIRFSQSLAALEQLVGRPGE